MSVRHSNHSQPQSLPPFAVAFSNSSLDRLSSHPASLPPIQPRPAAERPRSLPEPSQAPAMLESSTIPNGRKRSHPDASQHDNLNPDNSTSPHLGRVKTEHDDPSDDSHTQSRQPRSHPPPQRPDPDSRPIPNSASSSPSQPSPKKRRMTVSGPSHPVDQASSNPTTSDNKAASPPIVVAAPPMDRDDPSSLEQARTMPTVKRNQETPIEMRSQSLGGPLPSVSQTAVSPAVSKTPAGSSRPSARSPNMSIARATRAVDAPSDPNPVAPLGQSQQTDSNSHPPTHHQNSLPPPPISFAGRRTIRSPSSQKKPADIVISPRDARTQPVIQSAPPRQGGRFPPMALPSLPKVQQPPGSRRIPGNVPPTPTRLTLRSSLAASSSTSSLTVPPPASVPISTILVPQTPAVYSRSDSASNRSAFLAPFEALYDALRETKESRTWLTEQLAKVQALQTGFDAAVEAVVERRVGGLREEVARLQRRVEELECSRGTETVSVQWRRRSVANGDLVTPVPNAENVPVREMYTFPPVQPRASEGAAGDDLDMRETESPAPAFDVRRQSISAVRMDPPLPQSSQQQSDAQGLSTVKSPPSSGGTARKPSYAQPQPPPQHASSQPGSPVGPN
ncbi:hypothetical protein F5148DRAFT_979830 [Russula earlei]|uniref:Uncharacterized protein n=1 Tax=Russula earlei TaxID=71964 RepID=A0ACC0U9L0_9AGAM|nr:hypothetical protein F5148DRAFT_979830 [Russula earlei]